MVSTPIKYICLRYMVKYNSWAICVGVSVYGNVRLDQLTLSNFHRDI